MNIMGIMHVIHVIYVCIFFQAQSVFGGVDILVSNAAVNPLVGSMLNVSYFLVNFTHNYSSFVAYPVIKHFRVDYHVYVSLLGVSISSGKSSPEAFVKVQ